MEAKPHTDSGEFKVLANLGTTKTDLYPDAAFLKDKGYVGLDAWIGVVAPKGTPQETVDILKEAFKKGMEDPKVKEQFAAIGIEPAYAGPEDFAKTIADTAALTGDLAKQLGLVK
jgi:tripartite-type tricarboxylate transporter receptor subunit TctC